MIVEIAYCKSCGSEYLRKFSSEMVYCSGCKDYYREENLKYRDMKSNEEIVEYKDAKEIVDKIHNEFDTYCKQFDYMCTNCEYSNNGRCETTFAVKKLVELGMLKTEEKQTRTIEKDFNIKENQMYLITFESENLGKTHKHCVGEILNFDCNQFTIKGEDGLYIIQRRNIIEMIPSRRGENTNEKCERN